MKKIIIFLSLVFFLPVGISSYSQATPPQKETGNKAQSSAQNQKSTKNVIIAKQEPSTEKNQQTETQNQNKAIVETPDERIATFTGWLVIVAFIQALIFIAQAIAMSIQAKHLRRTVEATEKSAQAIIRMELPIIRATPAYLVYTDKPMRDDELYRGGTVNNGCLPTKFSIFRLDKIKNYGRSPAFPENISVGWMVANILPDKPQYIKSRTFSHASVIMPDDNISPDLYGGIELSNDELKGIEEDRLWLWLYGCLYYRDFMNERREFRFCWRYANQNPGEGNPHYRFSSSGAPPKEYTKNI